MRTRSEAIAANVMRRVMDNNKKRARYHLADEIYERFETMSTKSPSCVTDSMNIKDTPLQRAYLASLEKPAEQQAHAEPTAELSRIGTSTDKPRVSPTDYPGNNNPVSDNMSVNTTDGGAFTVKRDSYTQVEGKGVGPSTYRGQGDVAKAAVDKAADNGGVRSTVGQFQTSKNLPNQKLPFTSPVAGSEGDRA